MPQHWGSYSWYFRGMCCLRLQGFDVQVHGHQTFEDVRETFLQSNRNHPANNAALHPRRRQYSNFHGSMHRNNYSDIYPLECNVTQFILSGNCSTCFVWYLHQSSGVQTTVSTASGICHTVTVTCRYCGRVGTGLGVLWVVYAIQSTIKPVSTLPQ
jgi:hypothetical protein